MQVFASKDSLLFCRCASNQTLVYGFHWLIWRQESHEIISNRHRSGNGYAEDCVSILLINGWMAADRGKKCTQYLIQRLRLRLEF